MVEKNKSLFLLIISIAALALFAYSVSAAVTFSSPITFSNYTGTVTVNCTQTTLTDFSGILNATVYYNESGGAAGDALGTGHAVLISAINTTSDEYYNDSVVISGLADGLSIYNISCAFYNGTDANDAQFAGAAENITIDNIPPNVTDLSFVNSTGDAQTDILYTNQSGTINLNITVNDTIGGASGIDLGYVVDVYFNLTNSTGDTIFFVSAENTGSWNISIASNNGTFPVQNYTLNIWANDTLGNINFTESTTIMIDNNGPSITLAKSASTADAITITITPDDGLGTGTVSCSSNRGAITLFSVKDTNLECGTSYSYTITCNDFLPNAGSTTSSFSTDDCSGAPAGAGVTGEAVTAVPAKTYTISEEQFKEGYTKQLSENEQIKIAVENKEHTIKATDITATSITITVASEPQTATLSIGETKQFDVTADGTNDLSITLKSITDSKADLTVKSIPKEEAVAPPTEEKKPEVVEEEKVSLLWLWILIIIVIIAIIIYFVYRKTR